VALHEDSGNIIDGQSDKRTEGFESNKQHKRRKLEYLGRIMKKSSKGKFMIEDHQEEEKIMA